MSVIFLSAVSDEFRDYRDQLRSDLTRHNVEVKIQKDFKDYGVVILDQLDLYISTCDAVIHLVGNMTGSDAKFASIRSISTKYPDIAEKLPPLRDALDKDLAISYTQWEAWLALYHGKRLLIARADDAAPRGPNYSSTETSRAAQQMHLERLRAVERYPGYVFTSPDDLAKHIAYTIIPDLLAQDQQRETPRETGNLLYASSIAVVVPLFLMPLVAAMLYYILGVWWQAASLAFLSTAGTAALTVTYLHYIGVLGAESARQRYDSLRASLAAGGTAARLYSSWLARFLDAVERFLGDAGMADRTLLPHAFGLRKRAPLWTAPAFDRCMLLAAIYPIVTILIIWAVSGQVGEAGEALLLKPDYSAWQRGLLVAGSVSVSIAMAAQQRSKGRKRSFLLFVVAAVLSFAAPAFEDAGIYIIGGLLSMALNFVLTATYAGAGAYAICGVASMLSLYLGLDLLAFAGLSAAAALNWIAIRYRWQGVFLSVFLPATIFGCLCAAPLASSRPAEYNAGALLLFFGLLTLLNAPFAWASLGLTRALLRRGLELGGWWPCFLAFADALLAAVTVAVLAVTMVIGVQAFDGLVVRSGGKHVLPLGQLFDGISAHPGEPQYWWVYAVMLSSMIPSIVNLVIGGTALMRAAPGLPSLLLRYMPVGGAVPAIDRAWLAFVLTLQVVSGMILGIAAQALLALGLIGYVMPRLGLGLLALARSIEAFDLPMRVWHIFEGAF